MSDMTKSEWIESEYKKWEERFVIPFEDEFNVKALLDLRWQFMNTSEQYVRTKNDLVEMMNRIQRNFRFEQKTKSPNIIDRKIMIVVKTEHDILRIANMFKNNLDNVKSIKVMRDFAEIHTDEMRYFICKNIGQNLRGHRCQVVIDMTNDKDLEQVIIPIPVQKLR